MEYPQERYYKLNRFFLSVSGLWPYQSAWKARLFRAIITLVMFISLFGQFAGYFTSDTINMEFIIDVIPTLLFVAGCLCHLYARVLHTDKLRELLERMWNDWALQKTEDEIKIMHEYADITRLLMFYFSLLIYATMLGYSIWLRMPEILDIISPMNESRPRMQPYKLEFFIDKERYFYLISAHVYSVILVLPVVFLAAANLFLAVTQHVCAMCKLLGYRAERLFCIVQDTRCDLIHRKKINYRNITVLVRLHYNVIEFVGIIETYHSLPFALDLFGIVIVMSLTLIQILTFSGNTEQALRYISLGMGQLCYLFIFSSMAQKVTDMTSSVCEKVYNSAWYDADVSEQKSLLLIMKRRFHPLLLTAYNFYVMSLQNFGMILQTAISYCMFLKQV